MKYDIDYIKKLGFANRNFFSGRRYLGLENQKRLTDAGFSSSDRATFNQCKKNGRKIKAGSKGVVIQHKEIVDLEEKRDDGTVEIKKIPQVKSRLVFNLEQTEPVKVR